MVRSFLPSFGRSFLGWLVRSFVGSFVRWVFRSLVRRLVGWFVGWYFRSLGPGRAIENAQEVLAQDCVVAHRFALLKVTLLCIA